MMSVFYCEGADWRYMKR